MFTATQTLDDASGDDVVFTLVSQDGTGTRRLDVASNLAFPGLLVIKHSVNGSGANAVDRHLVQVSRTVDATSGPKTAVVNFTLSIPRDTAITNQIVLDMVANLVDFVVDGGLATPLAGTNIASLLRGEA